ncbi:MAG: radical SAM protein [Candidatus Cloacimonetes bacterium]|nr:radical SAM protein [Candidatus Cloacimonadota bacterium]
MKILLINPPLENLLTVGETAFTGKRGFFPSLGLLYVASYCARHTEHQVNVIDASLENYGYPELSNALQQQEYDVIGISTLTFSLFDSIKTTKLVKEIHPGVIIVWGGIHVTLYPEESINLKEVDFAVQGEGEITFVELLANLNNRKKLREVPGLLFKEDGNIINTGIRPPLDNLDILPFPARQLTPYHRFYSVYRKTLATTILSSRGCPFKCLFCIRSRYHSKLRQRSPHNVIEEIKSVVAQGIEEFHFYDDTFTLNRKHVLQFCRLIRKENLHVTWSIMTRVDMIDSEMLQEMKQAGCFRIRYGVESGNDSILEILRKGTTVAQIRNAFNITKKAGIETVAYFIIGSPGEKLNHLRDTLALARELNADFTNFSIMTVYPGTELYQRALANKIIDRDLWREYAIKPDRDFQLPLWEENFTRKELLKIQAKAYRIVYLRPQYIIRKFGRITSWKSIRELAHQGLRLVKFWAGPGRKG